LVKGLGMSEIRKTTKLKEKLINNQKHIKALDRMAKKETLFNDPSVRTLHRLGDKYYRSFS
jgi:hypothetical protein